MSITIANGEDAVEDFMRALWSLPQSTGNLPPDVADGYAHLRALLWQAQVATTAQALMPSEVAELRGVVTVQELTHGTLDKVRRWLALGVVHVDGPHVHGNPPTWVLTALGRAAIDLIDLIDLNRSET